MTMLAAAVMLTACRSHRTAVSHSEARADSTAVTRERAVVMTLDSALRSSAFVFDTLEMSVEHPAPESQAPRVIRLRAVKGSISDERRDTRRGTVNLERTDSTARHTASAGDSATAAETVTVAEPPRLTTALTVLTLALVVVLAIRIFRTRCGC